ncbi:MAG: NADH-quinone oxidoreductase subunit H [Deltaproteobacteria bacterium]|nr:NADH-quinone oxidoreductase subunit H [Deltaproteobacteria bacterium]
MSSELGAISPLAAYVGSFIDVSLPAWALMVAATAIYWFVLLLPPVAAMTYLDRKVGADIQMRIGPNRVSAYGVFQAVSDAIKLFFKEDSGPDAQEGWLFRWGIVAAIVCVFTAIGNIPMGENLALSNLDSGVIVVLTSLCFSNLCIFWAAYSAKSQWSVLSSFRVIAMVTAYIVPIAIAIVPPILIAGSPNLEAIVRAQGGMPWKWILFHNPGTLFSFVALFLALQIWQARAPFDHYRAQGEIAGGFTAEFSGMRRGLITLLEYLSLMLACMFIVTTYLGGWQFIVNLESFGRAANVVEFLWFLFKIFGLVFVSIWIRWSLPGLRADQIVSLSWKILVPIGLFGSTLTAIWLVVFKGRGIGDFL